jgi:hypothetical protein
VNTSHIKSKLSIINCELITCSGNAASGNGIGLHGEIIQLEFAFDDQDRIYLLFEAKCQALALFVWSAEIGDHLGLDGDRSPVLPLGPALLLGR